GGPDGADARDQAHTRDGAEARRHLRRGRRRSAPPRVDEKCPRVRSSTRVRGALKKLVILHIDGLRAAMLWRAVKEGGMPHVQRLLDGEGYALHRYRCGVPSTTPFSQAGVLYGDEREIPSFLWWGRARHG